MRWFFFLCIQHQSWISRFCTNFWFSFVILELNTKRWWWCCNLIFQFFMMLKKKSTSNSCRLKICNLRISSIWIVGNSVFFYSCKIEKFLNYSTIHFTVVASVLWNIWNVYWFTQTRNQHRSYYQTINFFSYQSLKGKNSYSLRLNNPFQKFFLLRSFSVFLLYF